MSIHDTLTRQSILDAIAECVRLGHDQFLRVYGFGKARTYYLVYEGKYYDSKAIVGVAHEFAHGKALKYDQFHGGVPVERILKKLNFQVEKKPHLEN